MKNKCRGPACDISAVLAATARAAEALLGPAFFKAQTALPFPGEGCPNGSVVCSPGPFFHLPVSLAGASDPFGSRRKVFFL